MKKYFLPLIALFLLVSCSDNEGKMDAGVVNNPATASEAANTKEPKIEFELTEYDFGNMLQGEKATYNFKFKNTGNAKLVISAVEKTCGCTEIKFPREAINPGESGSIKITFDSSSKKGMQNKRVIVKANTNPAETVLRFKAMVMTVND